MPNASLRPRLDRLNDKGWPAAVVEGSALLPAVLLADRSACAFQRFAAPGLKGGKAAKAAGLFAASSSPFADSQSLLQRLGPGEFGVWWIDLARLATQAESPVRLSGRLLLPESLAQAAPPPVAGGVAFRQLRLRDGYEAQGWREGRIIASSWRPQPFDDLAWRNFVRVLGAEGAPQTAPKPQEAPSVSRLGLYGLLQPRIDGATAAAMAAGTAAAIALGLVGWFGGQALRLNALADREAEQVAALQAQTPQGATAAERAAQAQAQALAVSLNRQDPVAALSVALGMARLHGLTPLSFNAATERVEITFPYAALSRIPPLTRELTGSGAFASVEASTRGDRSGVTLRLTPRARAPVAARPRA